MSCVFPFARYTNVNETGIFTCELSAFKHTNEMFAFSRSFIITPGCQFIYDLWVWISIGIFSFFFKINSHFCWTTTLYMWFFKYSIWYTVLARCNLITPGKPSNLNQMVEVKRYSGIFCCAFLVQIIQNKHRVGRLFVNLLKINARMPCHR